MVIKKNNEMKLETDGFLFTSKKQPVIRIEDILKDSMIAPSVLAEKCETECFSSGNITLVDTAPKMAEFCGALFVASFCFDKNRLYKIDLTPIMGGVHEPNYPTREYNEIARKYCNDILCNSYGKPSSVSENNTACVWEFPEYRVISPTVALMPHEEYSGGKIVIEIRWYDRREELRKRAKMKQQIVRETGYKTANKNQV